MAGFGDIAPALFPGIHRLSRLRVAGIIEMGRFYSLTLRRLDATSTRSKFSNLTNSHARQ
jgi:hypothetical protein